MKGFDKKTRSQIEVQPNDQVYIDPPPRRVQRSESESMDALTGYSENIKGTATEGGSELFSRRTGPYTVLSDTKSTATIDKDGVVIPVSPDLVTEMLPVPDTTEPTAGLQISTG